ncbi:unnamed protein product [Hymenolepis diminuta]|uniref:Uncharacterized protein n=1 Tax=Hymenolepis diminuta TaxID=6216 RepID=A0A564Y179_HYMDI|nr:unnamed protein product [Hymenolepis diminuta]VUZ45864.1 unnamed protein product [Hymenolepis diminuta]VUZ45865.1 unnamed protein product [Hymenolepis diminuta]VUZ50617.1 unnamed protein product [Hymenolepis diminuta]
MTQMCPGLIYSIIWLFLVLWVAWPVAAFTASIYVFLLPFAACIPSLEGTLQQLLVIVELPLVWAKKCLQMSPLTDCSV